MHFNRFDLEDFARKAAQAYLQTGDDLNDSITKIARENDFTPHHVDRVVQTANTLVNGHLVKQARDKNVDPRVAFELAKSSEVAQRLSTNKVASLRKEAQILSMFKVEKKPVDTSLVVDALFGKMASDPFADHARSLDHMTLTESFIKNADLAETASKDVTSSTLGLACQSLESLRKQAHIDHNTAKNAMVDAEADLRSEINDQILSGTSPATIRDVIKNASIDEKVAVAVDTLITKVAAGLGAREGRSAFCDRSLVNKQHPLIEKAAAVDGKVAEAVRIGQGLAKFAAAHKAAGNSYAQAVRQGR